MDHRGNELEAGYIDFTEIATPGSNPASGKLRFYPKSDNNFYKLTSGGAESLIGGGAAAITTPGTISNLWLWFQPKDLALVNGQDAIGWPDSGPTRASLVGAAGVAGSRGTIVTNAINGFSAMAYANVPGLRFNAYAGTLPMSITRDTWTLFAVLKWTSAGTTENDFFALNDGNSTGMRIGLVSTGKLQITYPGVGSVASNETPSLNAWHYLIIKATSSVITARLDGVALTGLGTQTMTATAISSFNVAMGNNSANYFFQGSLAELAFYENSSMASGDITTIESYAHTQYGI